MKDIPFNGGPAFDANVEEALKCYVYVLFVRRDGAEKVFYVGKGGAAGAGNDRVLHHFDEAKNSWPSSPIIRSKLSEKIRRMHEIREEGGEVEWKIIRSGLDIQTAFHVEAALIDLIGIDNLTNSQGGHGKSASGSLSKNDVYRLAAPPVAPREDFSKVLIFSIGKLLKQRTAYDATRCWWSGTRKHEDATHAVGVVDKISHCVIEIERGSWESREDDARTRGFAGEPPDYDDPETPWEKGKRRRGFKGKAFVDTGSHELLDKNYSEIIAQCNTWKRGNWLAVEFRAGEAIILRGRNKPKATLPGTNYGR